MKVSFNAQTLKRFKKAYEACTDETFEFEGNAYVKDYAKYVIEYLENKFRTTNE